METVWGVEQSCYGHCYRWIVSEKRMCEEVAAHRLSYPVDQETVDVSWPLGGSNASATYFCKLASESEVREFLLEPYTTDYEDPELVDIAEGIMTIDSDYDTEDWIWKLGIKKLTWNNAYLYETQKMIDELIRHGCDQIDADRPFYGTSRNMRLSEVEKLYKEVTEK